MKTSYKGFRAGQTVILNVSGVHDMVHVDRGTEFEILNFPPKVRYSGTELYFVHGITKTGQHIRVNLNQIITP